ncbi:MAG: hypothetical protein OEV21_07035, partial [Thermoplasmata archaeon]|nr:hypothetical protein [Thermoplasmata archaeon]
TANYHLGAWEDESNNVWSGAWGIEAQHMDWAGNVPPPPAPGHASYPSPYNKYDPDQTDVVRDAFVPWTTTFAGPKVSYWIAPLEMDLIDYESIIVKLPTTDVLGIKPGKGSSNLLDAAKYTELTNNLYWGRMALSAANYADSQIASGYNPATKTLSLVGPIDFANSTSQGTGILDYGIPSLLFDVQMVTSYDVQVTGAHMTTVADTVTVTAKNGTGATVTGWNGTVYLSCTDPGALLGSASHPYVPASDNGVWSTTVTWANAGIQYVNASDMWFSPTNVPEPVVGLSGPIPVNVIPEFGTLMVPIIGAFAIFLVFRLRKRREEDE